MNTDYISRERFKEMASSKQDVDGYAIRGEFVAEVKVESDEKRELLFTVSTSSVDRQGDSISVEGWELEAYRKNPVVLWAHDYSSLPVAKSREIWIESGKLKSLAEFTPKGLAKFNDIVFEMYKLGFMQAVSVGFSPIKWAWTEDKDRRFGIDFEKQELLEYSAVPVPANAEALLEAKSAGIDLEPQLRWAYGIIRRGFKAETKRDFESLLRDVGFSQRESKALASRGWTQRDVEEDTLHAVKSAFSDVRSLFQ